MPPCSPDTLREILNLCTLVRTHIAESDSPIPSTEVELMPMLARSIDKYFCEAEDGNKLHNPEFWKKTAAKNLVSMRGAMAMKARMEDVGEVYVEAQNAWKSFEGDADDRFMTDSNIDKAVYKVEKKLAVLQDAIRGKKRKFEEDVEEDVEEDSEEDSEGDDYEDDGWIVKEDVEEGVEEVVDDVEEGVEEGVEDAAEDHVKEDVEEVVGQDCPVD